METLPIPHNTIVEMVAVYRQSCEDLKTAFALLVGAEARLRSVFGTEHYGFDMSRICERCDFAEPEPVLKKLKLDAWRVFVDRMELKRYCSIKKAEEIDKQLEKGETLPEITEQNIMQTLSDNLTALPQMIEEAVKEVFEFLRPSRSQYKTNTEFDIGERVVLSWCVEYTNYSSGKYRIHYSKEQHLRALDNVFLMLDGKGIIKTYKGPLIEAIQTTQTGHGETDYFEFRCYQNRNLHLRFKRMDLVKKLNATAGGMRLYQPEN